MIRVIAYIKARLDERSTWALIGAGITGAAALAWPWNLAFAIVATIGALVPSGPANA